MTPTCTTLDAYRAAFSEPQTPFLTAYDFDADKQIQTRHWTRGEFWECARRIATRLRLCGVTVGSHVTFCMGANQPHDLASRLACVMVGAIPVSVNWQSDTLDRVLYKIRITASHLVLTDDVFDREILQELNRQLPSVQVLDITGVPTDEPLDEAAFTPAADEEATRIVIFTSGTTGQPKGVKLPFRAYATNRLTFEQFLDVSPEHRFAALIVNPLHHTNSTAITDWGLRRPGSELHLVSRYSTSYWGILCDLADTAPDRLIAPVVARHFDFLENLDSENRLPVPLSRLQRALASTTVLIGSAPVGPTTVKRLQHYAGRAPTVRFGSTETCLQVIGVPTSLDEATRLRAFEAGWNHQVADEPSPGYYIGRAHSGHTEVRVVKAIAPGHPGYMVDCAAGHPGYVVTRGGNLMTGYVGEPAATEAVFAQGWYTGLKDIGFWLRNVDDGGMDVYWQSRESSLLIRGGANYAYDQINAELMGFLERHFALGPDAVDVAVVGLNVDSEHDDSCCVTLELKPQVSAAARDAIGDRFLPLAQKHVTKGAKPDYLRLANIPRNFKGTILVPELKEAYSQFLTHQTATIESPASRRRAGDLPHVQSTAERDAIPIGG